MSSVKAFNWKLHKIRQGNECLCGHFEVVYSWWWHSTATHSLSISALWLSIIKTAYRLTKVLIERVNGQTVGQLNGCDCVIQSYVCVCVCDAALSKRSAATVGTVWAHTHVITAMHLLLSLVDIAKVAELLLFVSCKSSFGLSCTHSAQISRSCRVFCSCQARIMHFAVFCIECQPSLAVKNIPTCATDKQLSRESHYALSTGWESQEKLGVLQELAVVGLS